MRLALGQPSTGVLTSHSPCHFPLLKNDKKHQLEGKLQDIRCRLASQRQEIESTNKSRELRIAEITHLQQQLQVGSTAELESRAYSLGSEGQAERMVVSLPERDLSTTPTSVS